MQVDGKKREQRGKKKTRYCTILSGKEERREKRRGRESTFVYRRRLSREWICVTQLTGMSLLSCRFNIIQFKGKPPYARINTTYTSGCLKEDNKKRREPFNFPLGRVFEFGKFRETNVAAFSRWHRCCLIYVRFVASVFLFITRLRCKGKITRR